MDSKQKIIKASNTYYKNFNEQFTRKLLSLNSYIDEDESNDALNYSHLIHALYNISDENNKDEVNLSYFLKFAIYYLKGKQSDNLLSYYEQLVSITTLGLLNQRINDIRLLLEEEELTDIDYDKYNWVEILYIETMRLYLLIVRQGKGFKDIDTVNENINRLIEIQEEKEEVMVKAGFLSQREMGQLVILYNTIAALNDVNQYLEKGHPAQINVKLDRYFDNIKEGFSSGVDARFQYSIENIIKGLEITIKNSIWKQLKTGTRMDEFVEEMVARGNEKPIFQLLPSQVDAFQGGIDRPLTSAIVIQMHTSAGKSLLAHFLIAQTLEMNSEGQIAYVVPTRALVHQSLYDLRNTFINLDYNIEATIPAYEIDKVEEELLDERIDILVTTPEKLNLLVRSNHPSVKELSFVIVDEAHNISDNNRGPALEFLLATLKRKNEYIRTLLLTPFIKDDSNRELIAHWLGGDRGLPVYSKWRPTRQIISLLKRYKPEGSRYYKFSLETIIPDHMDEFTDYPEFEEEITFPTPKPSSLKSMATAMAKRFISKGAVLILAESPFHAENQAKDLADSIDDEVGLSEDLKLLIKFAREELGEKHTLLDCLRKRVAFHHSGLSEEIKILLEKLIVNGDIDYIVGTTTLAQGMNFPISTVIFRTIYFPRPFGENVQMEPEVFWNIAGRAGRVFKDYAGRIIFLANGEERENEIKDFLQKRGEGINSAIFETIKNIDEFSLQFDRELVMDNQALSQLLQFISGTLNLISENGEISENVEQVIDEVLRLSLAYRQLSDKGEAERKKLLNIAQKYLAYLQRKDNWKGVATLVDQTGFSSMTVDYLMAQKRNLPNFAEINLKDVISESEQMTNLIKILGGIPEINLGAGTEGSFNPGLVAAVTQAWINGISLTKIYDDLLAGIHDDIRKSIKYIYQTITGKVSWGMGAMQSISLSGEREDVDEVLNLPSMIYYGVPNDIGVALRMAGVPRTLAVQISQNLTGDEFSIKENKLSGTRQWLQDLSLEKWNRYAQNSNLNGKEWKRIWELIEA